MTTVCKQADARVMEARCAGRVLSAFCMTARPRVRASNALTDIALMRVLVLENGSWATEELSKLLRKQGCAVEMAPATEPIARGAPAQAYDLVIVDISSSGAHA